MERARHKKSKSASGIEGIQQIQQAVSRLSTDSRSYIDGCKREDMLGQSSSTGIPMKKLLAEEMSKEIEPKRRSPGVIARLMGLEGLPSPKHVHGQQKKLPSDGHQIRNASTKSRTQRYDGPTNRSPMDPPEFKDVYEDLEASQVANRRYSSRWTAKQLHDQQDDHANTLIPVLKSSDSEKYESKSESWRSERDISSRYHVTTHVKRKDGLLLEPDNQHMSHASRTSSRTQLEPTRIVVLKPNIGKIQNASTSSSIPSPDLSHGYRPSFEKIKEYLNIVETLPRRGKYPSRHSGLSKPLSREAREIAREITTRMRDLHDENMDARSVGYRGYVGDDSSYDANESDSGSESEAFGLFRRKSFDDNNNNNPNTSVNREARRRLSERWKMTRKYQDLEVVSKGSTLGEMLALPDRVEKTRLDRASDYRYGGNNGTVSNSSRSKSLPPSTGRKDKSHRRRTYHDDNLAEKNGNRKRGETLDCNRSKRNINRKEDLYSSKYSKSRGKKSHPCEDIFIDEMDTCLEVDFEIQMEANIKDLSEQHQPVFEISANTGIRKSPVVDLTMITEPATTTLTSDSSELIRKQSSSVIDGDESAAEEEEEGDCSLQELHKVQSKQASPSLRRLEYFGRSKEVDHPSPISVLQLPFAEDTSSSESFERVGTELQELRLQLQLLKLESRAEADESALFPIEEGEDIQPSPVVSEGNYVLGWEIFYALDVLITSGLRDSDLNMFRTSWYSPDCPLDPNLFDDLEKKYCHDDTTGTRSERRLLFDRINSALLQIFAEHFDLCPWVMPKLSGCSLKWQRQGVRDAVEKLIEQELSKVEMSDKDVDREMQWSGSKGEIEMIGNEIEKMLVDDIINEVLYVCNN